MWEQPEDAFKELDNKISKQSYGFVAVTLGGLREALLEQKFSARESFRITEHYAKMLFEMTLDEARDRQFLDSRDSDDPVD